MSQSLLRGRPIQSDEAAPLVTAVGPGTSVSTIDTPVAIAELIANCNTICKSFSWSDDGEKEDHEDEDRDDEASIDSFCNGLFWERRAIDLIEAGVFKRTFEILKEQPRCMLCSVCFRTGDMVTESCNGRQVCHHQFHPGCLLNWVRKKTTTSSRSKPTTGKGDSCIGAIGVCCPICKEVYTEL